MVHFFLQKVLYISITHFSALPFEKIYRFTLWFYYFIAPKGIIEETLSLDEKNDCPTLRKVTDYNLLLSILFHKVNRIKPSNSDNHNLFPLPYKGFLG
jgi:hypothetical protein